MSANLTWRHVAWTLAAAAIVGLTAPWHSVGAVYRMNAGMALLHVAWLAIAGVVFLVAVAFTESRSSGSQGPSAWRHLGAVAAAALGCFALAIPYSAIRHHMETRDTRMGRMVQADIDSGRIDARLRDFLWLGGGGAVFGALAALLYVRLRNARRMALALDEAELDRAQTQRDLVASQVQALRARIDPTFVFARLATIEQAYEQDPAAADALLDELIAFLREAIPRLRTEGSLKEAPA